MRGCYAQSLWADDGATPPTVVLVAHRLSTVVNAHNIVVVDKGVAAEQGRHEELLAREGKYADLVRTQLQKQAETAGRPPPAAPPAEAPGPRGKGRE